MQFSKFKALIEKYNISTPLSSLDSDVVQPAMPKEVNGERIEVRQFVDPFFLTSLKRQGAIEFTATNLNQDDQTIELPHQKLNPSPAQIESILSENFGAVIIHNRYFHFLNKDAWEKRQQYLRDKAQYDEFVTEYKRVDDIIREQAYLEVTG